MIKISVRVVVPSIVAHATKGRIKFWKNGQRQREPQPPETAVLSGDGWSCDYKPERARKVA